MTDLADERSPTARRYTARVWVLALVTPVVVVGLAIGLVVGLASGDGDEPAANDTGLGLAAAPLELASVSTDMAGHYAYATEHQGTYGQIPCFCGCEEFLDHRNLYDCFVRSDGKGWDAHASGCGVCIGESATARRLLDEGQDPAAVRDAVVARFGSTPGTAPPRA